MFREKEKEAYRKIVAPPELKDKIIASFQEESEANREESISLNVNLERKKGGFKWLLQPKMVATVCSVCIVFVLSILFIKSVPKENTNTTNVALYLYGTKLTNAPMEITTSNLEVASVYQRSNPDMEIPLDIKTEKKVEIMVSSGTLEIVKEGNDQNTECKDTLILNGNQSVCWRLMPNKEENSTLTIRNDENEQCYILSYDEKKECFILYQP